MDFLNDLINFAGSSLIFITSVMIATVIWAVAERIFKRERGDLGYANF